MDAGLLAKTIRSGRIECEHHGWVAVSDAAGRLTFSVGDVRRETYLRSSAKPFQTATAILSGAADAFGWSADDLAIASSSHSTEEVHLAAVRQLLAKSGGAESELQCGPHPPLGDDARRRLAAAGVKLTGVHSNCSGKHSAMIATCRHCGWNPSEYRRPDHPLQLANNATLARFAGRSTPIPTGLDGCGVPTFFVSISETARAFARLVDPSGLDATDRAAAEHVSEAMRGRPDLVAGTGRLDTTLMRSANGRLLVKGGAEGVLCAALPERGLGIAIKIADGNPRAHAAVLARVLERVLPELDLSAWLAEANPPILNTIGEPTGEIVAAL